MSINVTLFSFKKKKTLSAPEQFKLYCNYIVKELVKFLCETIYAWCFYRKKLFDDFISPLVIGLLKVFLSEAGLVKYIFLENFTFSNLFQT